MDILYKNFSSVCVTHHYRTHPTRVIEYEGTDLKKAEEVYRACFKKWEIDINDPNGELRCVGGIVIEFTYEIAIDGFWYTNNRTWISAAGSWDVMLYDFQHADAYN